MTNNKYPLFFIKYHLFFIKSLWSLSIPISVEINLIAKQLTSSNDIILDNLIF